MRLVSLAPALLLCTACASDLQQQAAFGAAPVVPARIDAHVGDVVAFQVRPPVAEGSQWLLECHGRARFANAPTSSAIEWIATPEPIRMEAVQSPWDTPPERWRASSRAWLWYGLAEHGESQPLDRELPVRRLPFREIAPVTFASTFSIAPHPSKISARRERGRILVTYATPVEPGAPRAPTVDAMLLETDGKRMLYAEVTANFGQVNPSLTPPEPIGYEVTLSYDGSVPSPIEVVVVGWIGHGSYYRAFTVDRMNLDTSTLKETAPPLGPVPRASAPS